MNRLVETFKKLKSYNKTAFIAYVAAGDPDMRTSEYIVRALSKSGVDIIELGIPFSDPMADGPTIQRAAQRALESGATVKKIMGMAKRLREEMSTPFVYMTYYNIVLNYGIKNFIADSLKNGVDGLIVPDAPMEEAGELVEAARNTDFSVILLAAPTTSVERYRKIASLSRGFVYYVSLTGVTGARKAVQSEVKKKVSGFKKCSKLPVCVGFGVSTSEQAKTIAKYSDGVIVGSAIVNIIAANLKNKKRMIAEISKFVEGMANAVHGG
ncbi:MAG: tryptophan synthase subunit alpha [Candidatus Omnitrophica bacterium]|nr:tryptophan synthase subunit alpha [Candidatus Omnitrophota bacterium]